MRNGRPPGRRSRSDRRKAAVLVAAGVLMSLGGGGVASAVDDSTTSPQRSSPTGSHIVEARTNDGRNFCVDVYSAAMNRIVQVEVQRARAAGPTPMLYLLNGGGGGEDAATWQRQTDVLEFLADKQVNVVQLVGGKFSYYTDWRAPDPVLGVNRWRTFLTEELPPLLDAEFRGNGLNAIAGVSMSATSALQLAIDRPDLYRSIASYSGCAQISDPYGHSLVATVVGVGGGNVENMYGPITHPDWAANDPFVHADRLRGKNIFISSGNGLPGGHDTLGDPHLMAPGPGGLANQVVLGGIIEAAAHTCAVNLRNRLHGLGIPATYDIDGNGSHSWGYWQDMFKRSWPVLAAGLGLPIR
ncbi:alpha/beta hydrolase [Nocardia sp. NPDC127526]|uniref:alpha/beta hydrolase n=1 Tax=Nocardia sp. NPDC127526 TaxID=3345393 RepID=UPI003642903B